MTREEDGPRAAFDLSYGVALFVVALVVRLRASFALAGEAVWDGHYYDFGARRIAAGFGYSDDITIAGVPTWHPWCHYPVGYSAYLGAFYRLFGTERWVPHVADGLVGALLAVVTFLLAREALSPVRARIAGALVALHPGLVLYSALEMSEPLAGLLVLAAFWVAIRVARAKSAERRPWLGPVLGALVLGVGVLVRPQTLLCAPFLGLAAKGRHARMAGAVLACVVSLLPVLPWTARNCRVMDSCALVSTNAGWNLAIGSFPRATGRFETLRSADGCREVTGQVQQDRCWLEYGIANIEAHPLHWLALVPAKLAFTFDHESFAVEYLHEARPDAWPDERRVTFRAITTSVHRVLVAASSLAFVALIFPRRRLRESRSDRHARLTQSVLLAAFAIGGAIMAFAVATPTFWPIVVASCVVPWLRLPGRPAAHPALLMASALIATTVIAHAVFFGEDRYHVATIPAFCLLAAAALRRQNTHGADTDGVRAAGPSSS